jgi:peptide deformylase
MTVKTIVQYPNPIFKQVAAKLVVVDDAARALVQDLLDTLAYEQAVGLAAPMIGVSQRIAVVDLNEDGVSNPMVFINPEITARSEQTQTHEEASLSLRGISAQITRPQAITVVYLDAQGALQEMKAEGFLATVIQHEMDYLEGKTYLDYLSPLKRDMQIKKMEKFNKMHPPHVHGAHCHH